MTTCVDKQLLEWIGTNPQRVLEDMKNHERLWWRCLPGILQEMWEELPFAAQLIAYKQAEDTASRVWEF